jgi:outer membrane protein
MKKIIWSLFLVFTSISAASAQNWAYVDSEAILEHMSEYVAAKRQITALTDQFQKELDQKNQEIQLLAKSYQNDQVLMTDIMKKRHEAEIAEKQKLAREFQLAKFGREGELAQKSAALIKPLQDKIAKAIKDMAEKYDLAMVFDKNNELTMPYANPRYDKTKEVLALLGLRP